MDREAGRAHHDVAARILVSRLDWEKLAVALVCALTPLGKVAGSCGVSNLLLYAGIGLLA